MKNTSKNFEVIVISENPLSRIVAPLVKELEKRDIPIKSVKIGENFTYSKNSIIHAIGLKAAAASKHIPLPRVISLWEKPARNFFARRIQMSYLKGAIVVGISDYIAKLWKTKNSIIPGMNLKIFNPESIPARRQVDILKKYNIPSDKKMVICISPAVSSLSNVIAALKFIDRDDFIITMHGIAKKSTVKKMFKAVANAKMSDRIIFMGDEFDVPSILRSSFATISFLNPKFVAASVAMGTPTISTDTEWAREMFPNYLIKPNNPELLAETLNEVLDLTAAKKEKIEKQNVKLAAEHFSIEDATDSYIALYQKL
jgi:glycosyltransferase involved in cell wall biosynthesis